MVPLETPNVWRMSGARTPKATRSKYCTPARPTSTPSGTAPAGPRSARKALTRPLVEVASASGIAGAFPWCRESRDRFAGRRRPEEGHVLERQVGGLFGADARVGKEAGHHQTVAGGDAPQDAGAHPEHELPHAAG